MRLAIQDSFPNKPETAEREFIARFAIACARLGLDCRTVVTSDDIIEYQPDAVIVTHDYSPKLTPFPTIGLLWNPLTFFRDDADRMRSVMSWDGMLAGGPATREFARDIQAGLDVPKPVADALFPPSTITQPGFPLETGQEPSLCYLGVHWEGERHRALLDSLVRRGLLTVYGPPDRWRDLASAYGGELPFDGVSVAAAIARHGICLCLNKAENRAENLPSMRLFEACAAGALPICDGIGFARTALADVAAFIDVDQPPERIADEIEVILRGVRADGGEGARRARQAKRWFEADWSLEHLIETVALPLIAEVTGQGHFGRGRAARGKHAAAGQPGCEVVVRAGGREPAFLARALASLAAANSDALPVGALVVDYRGREDLRSVCADAAAGGLPVRYIRSTETGFRSTALWDGLRAATAPLVAQLDDDDTVFPNHYRQLAAALERAPGYQLSYSGAVMVEDEPGRFVDAPNFAGSVDRTIPERRKLGFLQRFDLDRLARIYDNFILSHAWMARTPFVQAQIGGDPLLTVSEDVYLFLLLAAHGPFGFTGSVTAQWHWRSGAADNSMLAVDRATWDGDVARVKTLLADRPFRRTLSFAQLNRAAEQAREAARPAISRDPPAPRRIAPATAAGRLDARTQAVAIRAGAAGRLYLGDDGGAVRTASASDGIFAGAAGSIGQGGWYLFLPEDSQAAAGPVDIEARGGGETRWRILPDRGEARFGDMPVNADRGVPVTLALGARAGMQPTPLHFILHETNGETALRTRPFYGSSWTVLPAGGEAADAHGRYRDHPLPSLALALSAAAPEQAAVDSLLAGVLVRAIARHLAAADLQTPESALLARAAGDLLPFGRD